MNYNFMLVGIDASRANNQEKTGVEWYAFFLIQEFKKIINHKSEIISEPIEVVLYSDRPLEGELADLPANWRSKVLNWPPKRLWTQVRLSWEMLIHPPDVLFIPAHVFPIIHPKKTVMTVHDVAAVKFPESYNWFERWYSLWSAKYAVRKLWKVIVPSEFTKCELLKLETGNWKLGDKVFAIKHGYNRNCKVIDDEKKIGEVLEKYGVKKPFIMTIGRLEEKKNTVNMIRAFKKIKQNNNNPQFQVSSFQFLLVGKPGHGYEKVAAEIENTKDVITPGWVEEADVPYLMNAVEVFVFPSLYEGFGLPVLEAMACGTPVVASKGNSLNEVGWDGPVYVDPQSVEDIAGGILELLENRELRKIKIEKGLERVKEFSWGKCAAETFDVLKDNY